MKTDEEVRKEAVKAAATYLGTKSTERKQKRLLRALKTLDYSLVIFGILAVLFFIWQLFRFYN